jgi:hypothetical protein
MTRSAAYLVLAVMNGLGPRAPQPRRRIGLRPSNSFRNKRGAVGTGLRSHAVSDTSISEVDYLARPSFGPYPIRRSVSDAPAGVMENSARVPPRQARISGNIPSADKR